MNEDEVRKIVRDEMQRNYISGSPMVAPHKHDGTANLLINQQTLGFVPIPESLNKVSFKQTTNSNGVVGSSNELTAYGFGSPNILSPASSGHLQQYIDNGNVLINPIPVVVGNGVGTQSAFNGGNAPDGTVILFTTGVNTTTFLYVRFDGAWYGVNLVATPITP